MEPELRVHQLEGFLKNYFTSHFDCDDDFYSCPKTPYYLGEWRNLPIEERPCTCGYDEAMRLLGIPQYRDPSLQDEYEHIEMPEGEW